MNTSRRIFSRRSRPGFFHLLLLLGLLLSPVLTPSAEACSWPYQEPAFWREYMAGPERDALVHGQVGIIDNNWKDPGLFLAWRHFEGLGVPEESLPAFWLSDYDTEPADTELADTEPADENAPVPEPELSAVDQWQAAVKAATGKDDVPWPSPEFGGEVPDPKEGTQWIFFLNCLDPAFKTATLTLGERQQKYGQGSRELNEWLRGQSRVFEACSAIVEAPPELDGSWPAELRADRQYQIAATDFYAMRYEAAAARFRRIAADKSSPWRAHAAISVPRTTLRRGLFAEAAAEFRALLKNNDVLEFHPSAERLAQFAEMRADTEGQAKKIEATMRAKKLPTFPIDALLDVRWLARKLEPSPERPLIYFLQSISSWRIPAAAAYAHWQKSKTPTSLVVALIRASEALHGNNVETEATLSEEEHQALVDAAAKIGKGSAAYLSARFYRAQILTEALGRDDEARKELDQLLADKNTAKVYNQGDIQRLRHLRAHLAQNWQELVSFGLLTPIGETDEEGTVVNDIDVSGYNNELAEDERILIPVATTSINRFATLADLAQLQKMTELPKRYRRDLALSGFLRAALQGKNTEAEAFAKAAETLDESLGVLFADWRAAADADRKKFAVVLVDLKNPGFSIDLWESWGRNLPREELSSTRENWWCAVAALPADKDRPSFLRGLETPDDAGFGWPAGPNHLGREVLAFAAKYPDDPRLAEALHRTVRGTRLGCYGESYAEVSKGAFTLLHKRFPKTEWAKQTPYWFE